MKQIIPFTKDITFKNTIGDLVSISLDNDLQLKGEDLITGNFYVKGKYKLTKASIQEEEYSYKIPCEIAISDDYDTFDATIDIDDFYYDIIDNEILRINIDLVIDNLVKKEVKEKEEDVRNKKLQNLRQQVDLEDRLMERSGAALAETAVRLEVEPTEATLQQIRELMNEKKTG